MKRGAFATLIGVAVALSCGGSDENVARIRHGDAATAGLDASAGASGAGAGGTTDGRVPTAGRSGTDAGGAGTGGTESDASDAEASIDAARDGCPPTNCSQVSCQGHLRACGDCQDNDGDGLIDAEDPQ